MLASLLGWFQPKNARTTKNALHTSTSSSNVKTLSVCWIKISHSSEPETSLIKVFYFPTDKILRVCNCMGKHTITIDFEEDVSTINLINYIYHVLTEEPLLTETSIVNPTTYHIITNIGYSVDVRQNSINLSEVLLQTINIIRSVRIIKLL